MTTSRRDAAPTGARFAGPLLPGERTLPVTLANAVGFLAVGVLMLAWPNATLTVVAILIGVALIVVGLMRLYRGFFTARDETGSPRTTDVLIGVLAVIVGLFCLRHNALTIGVVAFIVGVFWVLAGLADIAIAATADLLPGRGLLALSGLISLIAGLLVLFWPSITVIVLVRILGIWLIIAAVLMVLLAFRFRADQGSAGSARPARQGTGT